MLSESALFSVLKVTGIRTMTHVQNRGPLEDNCAQNVTFFGKERNY